MIYGDDDYDYDDDAVDPHLREKTKNQPSDSVADAWQQNICKSWTVLGSRIVKPWPASGALKMS